MRMSPNAFWYFEQLHSQGPWGWAVVAALVAAILRPKYAIEKITVLGILPGKIIEMKTIFWKNWNRFSDATS